MEWIMSYNGRKKKEMRKREVSRWIGRERKKESSGVIGLSDFSVDTYSISGSSSSSTSSNSINSNGTGVVSVVPPIVSVSAPTRVAKKRFVQHTWRVGKRQDAEGVCWYSGRDLYYFHLLELAFRCKRVP